MLVRARGSVCWTVLCCFAVDWMLVRARGSVCWTVLCCFAVDWMLVRARGSVCWTVLCCFAVDWMLVRARGSVCWTVLCCFAVDWMLVRARGSVCWTVLCCFAVDWMLVRARGSVCWTVLCCFAEWIGCWSTRAWCVWLGTRCGGHGKWKMCSARWRKEPRLLWRTTPKDSMDRLTNLSSRWGQGRGICVNLMSRSLGQQKGRTTLLKFSFCQW